MTPAGTGCPVVATTPRGRVAYDPSGRAPRHRARDIHEEKV